MWNAAPGCGKLCPVNSCAWHVDACLSVCYLNRSARALCFRTNPLTPRDQKQMLSRLSRFSSKHPPTGWQIRSRPVAGSRFGTHWRRRFHWRNQCYLGWIAAGSRRWLPDRDRIADGDVCWVMGRGWICQTVAGCWPDFTVASACVCVCVCLWEAPFGRSAPKNECVSGSLSL